MIDPKTLKKLAATCRKAGISHYKCSEFEFTLTDSAPASPKVTTKRQSVSTLVDDTADSSEELSVDDLLFWSAYGQDPLAQGNT